MFDFQTKTEKDPGYDKYPTRSRLQNLIAEILFVEQHYCTVASRS